MRGGKMNGLLSFFNRIFGCPAFDGKNRYKKLIIVWEEAYGFRNKEITEVYFCDCKLKYITLNPVFKSKNEICFSAEPEVCGRLSSLLEKAEEAWGENNSFYEPILDGSMFEIMLIRSDGSKRIVKGNVSPPMMKEIDDILKETPLKYVML